MLFFALITSRMEWALRLGNTILQYVFIQGSVVLRSVRTDLFLFLSSFLNRPPSRHDVHAEGPRVSLALTLPKRGCDFDTDGDRALPEGCRYNLVEYVEVRH